MREVIRNMKLEIENSELPEQLKFNVSIAIVEFLSIIEQMNPSLSKWIQYIGFYMDKSKVYFKFKSSKYALWFEVCGQHLMNANETDFDMFYNEIYNIFKDTKYRLIGYKHIIKD